MGDLRSTRPIVLLLLGVMALAAAVFPGANPVTQSAQRYAETIAEASAVTYVTLRSLNAVLSTAQEVEVGASLGFSGSFQPGKVLEPVDDTIERIAGLVFTIMVTTGVLAVAMGPVSAVGFAMVAGALTLWAADLLIGRLDVVAVLARRLVWYGAFLAIALPLTFLLSSTVADRLTQDVWSRNAAVIDEITAPVSQENWVGQDGWIPDWMENTDRYRDLAQNVYERADDLISSYLAILAVFLFKVFILPALLMGGLFVIVRFFAHRDVLAQT